MNVENFDLDTLMSLWSTMKDTIYSDEIKEEIIRKSSGKTNFSREFFATIPNRAINFIFYPGTSAYESYGENVIGSVKFSEDELLLLIQNIANRANTYGIIKVEALPGNDLSDHQKENLIDVGFLTNDIYEIERIR